MGPDVNGQVIGTGCVCSAAIGMVTSRLNAKGSAWRGYIEDTGNDLTHDGRSTYSHPAFDGKNGIQSAIAMDGYATRHSPFMYFHLVTDNQPYCDSHVVRFDSLAIDLNSTAAMPTFSLIAPSLCDDGHDESIYVDGRNAGGLSAVNRFL